MPVRPTSSEPAEPSCSAARLAEPSSSAASRRESTGPSDPVVRSAEPSSSATLGIRPAAVELCPQDIEGSAAAQDAPADDGFDAVEQHQPRMPTRPPEPSSHEKMAHEVSGHAVYRSWCVHCIAAKGQGAGHRQGEEASEIPEIGIDYGYMCEDSAPGTHLPILILKDRNGGCFGATALAVKGVDKYALSYVVGWLQGLGHKRIVLRSDNERSLIALLKVVIAAMPGVEAVQRTSPEGDHQANGLAEVGVREIKGQIRVLRSQLEENLGRRLEADEPLHAWLPRHAANCINRYRIGSDGRTPEQRRAGRKWNRPALTFGETVYYRPVRTLKDTGHMSMKKGVFVGQHERTGANLLMTPEGLCRGVGLHRLPQDLRWDAEFLSRCRGLPWEAKPIRRGLPRPAVSAAEREAGVAPLRAPAPAAEGQQRRRYVLKADIEKYGGTDACRACQELHGGGKPKVAHSPECWQRITELMARDDDALVRARLEQDRLRRDDADDGEIQEDPLVADGQGQGYENTGQGGPWLDSERAEEPMDEEPDQRGSETPRPDDEAPEGAASSSSAAPRAAATEQDQREPRSEDDRARKKARPSEPKGQKRTGEESSGSDVHRARVIPHPRGEKRQPEQDASTLHDHLDADVRISPAALRAAAEEGEGELADGADADPSASSLSRMKAELLPLVEREIAAAFRHQGVDVSARELMDIAVCAVECSACDVAEIYTPPRFTPAAGRLGLRAGFCVDLTTEKPSGGLWDLSREVDRQELRCLQDREWPEILIGSPPCTTFCPLLHIKFTKEQIQQRREEEGEPHIRFCVERYRRQLELGRHFLHEHPKGSASWKMPEMVELINDKRTFLVEGPMCRWGMTARDNQGQEGFVRKNTRWLTSSQEIAEVLRGSCSNEKGGEQHRHVQLIGGGRAAAAAQYPVALVTAVLRGLQRQLREDARSLHEFHAGPVPEEEELLTGELPDDGVGYYDDVHGKKLDEEEVRKARALELDWILKQEVLVEAPEAECREHQGRPYTLKWVDTRKAEGHVRSRLVVREIKAAKREDEKLEAQDVFSAMPPVESLKILVSHCMTEQVDSRGRPLCIGVWDVSRAHFYGKSRRRVYTTLPEEMAKPGFVARLCKTMYGTQDAAHVWLETWGEQLEANEYALGKSNPAIFAAKNEDSRGMCHGDDFFVVACREELDRFDGVLKQKFEVKCTGYMGFAKDMQNEIKFLNRTIRLDRRNSVMEIEADERHVPRLLEELSLVDAKGVPTPRVKKSYDEAVMDEDSPLLEGGGATKFRSALMRAAYLAQDRVDLSEAVKCLSRHMAKPKESHMRELKRLGRYLQANPRRSIVYRAQDRRSAVVRCHVDSDWAGDPITRRSTTGLVVRRGEHLLKHSSTLQSTVGLSSAEAEYYALTKGACHALGLEAQLADWRLDAGTLQVYSDSSSARAFSARRGLGKMRHIQTRYLWLQERVALGHLIVKKVRGDDNVADVLTKAMTAVLRERYCIELGHASPMCATAVT